MSKTSWWIKLALGAIFTVGITWWLRPYFAGEILPNPVWLNWGGLELRWYGLLITLAVLACLGLVFWLNRRFFHFPPDPLFQILVWTVVGGILGARILFVGIEWSYYANHLNEIWQIRYGGMSIHGALIGGAVALWASAKVLRINIPKIFDLIALTLPLGQAIGRFGNFFNSEAFGGPTNLPWRMYISPEFRPSEFLSSNFFHPTFLYEAIGDLVIFGLLWAWFFSRHRPAGSLAVAYLVIYSSWRFVVEYFRIDSMHVGILTLAQWGSIALVLVGIPLLIYLHKKHGNN